jgi:hypothetical protein
MKTSDLLIDDSMASVSGAFMLLGIMSLSNGGRVPQYCPPQVIEGNRQPDQLYAEISAVLARFSHASVEAEEFAETWLEGSKTMPNPMPPASLAATEYHGEMARAFELVVTWRTLTTDERDLSAARKWLATLSFEEKCCLKFCSDLYTTQRPEIESRFRQTLNHSYRRLAGMGDAEETE